MSKAHDYNPAGIKIEGQWENDRNLACTQLFEDILTEVFGKTAERFRVIVGHHITYQRRDLGPDGFYYTQVEEIPSADCLMFDHEIAKALWGGAYLDVLQQLACEPVETRDALLSKMYYEMRGNEDAHSAR